MKYHEKVAALKKAGVKLESQKKDVVNAAYASLPDSGDNTDNVTPPTPPKNDESSSKDETTKNVYTYVGAGADSPSTINFMGREKFLIGKSKVVNDEIVLAKIAGNPCFVEGQADDDLVIEIAEAGKEAENEQRAEDSEIQGAETKRAAKHS